MEKFSLPSKIAILILLLSILIAPTLVLSFCNAPASDLITEEQYESLASDLMANVEAGCDTKYGYVASYLEYWGFPTFNVSKMKFVESTYNSYFIDDLGYSQSEKILALATTVAKCYIEKILLTPDGEMNLSIEDVRDVNLQTDAVVTAYAVSLNDKYSRYYNAEAYEAFIGDLSGTFAGIGVYVLLDREANTVTVSDLIKGSAAETAGILPGDMIIAVDGKSINDYDVDTFMDFVKGELGTPVTVTVLRDGGELSFTMNRISVETPSVDYAILEGDIVYMVISSFNENTDEQFLAMMDEIEQEVDVKGYIFDLRYNGGGYCDVAVNILSHFVPKGTKIVSEYKKSGKIWYESESDHVITEPIVVICNEYSASAAELFTASIRDFRDAGLVNAKIVGVTTYGKGRLQTIFPFTDMTAVVFTTGLFNPPSDVNFDGVGVIPDETVTLIPDGEVDNQFEFALEQIKNMISNQN